MTTTAIPTTGAATERAPAARPAAGREAHLDAIRAIATVRVVLWHTFAAPFLSFLVASMPTMFFVAGSLLSASLDRRSARTVIVDRMRRLLVPFWVFAAFVLSVLTFVHLRLMTPDTRFESRNLLAWALPIVAPRGTVWEGGWLAQPLWYLRTLLWLFVLAPVLRELLLRAGAAVLAFPVAGVFIVDHWINHPANAPKGFAHLQWFAGDLCLYSTFLMLGFLHRRGAFAGLTRLARTEWLVVTGGLATVWCATHDLPGGVVNNSYPAHLLVGLAWLMAAMRFESALGGLPANPIVGPAIRVLNQRALTIYLWHTTSIVIATWLLERFAPGAPRVAVLLPIIVVLAVFIAVFGWVEDVAARRSGRLWPWAADHPAPRWRPSTTTSTRLRAIAGGLGGGLALASVVVALVNPNVVAAAAGSDGNTTGTEGATSATTTAAAATAKRPAPSARPALATFDTTTTAAAAAGAASSVATAVVAGTATSAPATGPKHAAVNPALAAKLQAAVDAWRTELEVKGVIIGVELPDGSRFMVGSGASPDTNAAMDPTKAMAVTSLTKTFTASLALQLVGDGKLTLDAPVAAPAAVPDFPYAGQLTLRELLMHTSGLDTYQETDQYKANPGMNVDPATAVKMGASRPLLWKPGTNVGYSSSGYLLTGLLEEQATGAKYEDEVTKRFITKLGLTATHFDDTVIPGWIGWSTGGLWSNVPDMLTWGTGLYRDRTTLGPDLSAQMVNIDNEFSVGLGAWPVCPCSTGPNGEKVVTSIGHNGGSATLQYSPADKLVMFAGLTESIFDRITQQDVYDLFARMRPIIAAG